MNRGLISSCRVLDLADEKGLLCGKVLGDLGADVIKVERPGGDAARRIAPFLRDDAASGESLLWLAYNSNKRAITLDLGRVDGARILRKLVETTDILVESFAPGHLDKMGLGYATLSEINPRIIVVSISPFGQTGPHSEHKSSDLVAMSMGGFVFSCGDRDRAPVRVSAEQAYRLAGSQAAAAALIAYLHQQETGRGQHIDVSVHECVVWAMMYTIPYWAELKRLFPRSGNRQVWPGLACRLVFPCKDGYVGYRVGTGALFGPGQVRLVEVMNQEGIGHPLRQVDWHNRSFNEVTQAEMDLWEGEIIRFFTSHTKAELLEIGRRHNIMISPVYTTQDIVGYPQLAARRYWAKLEQPGPSPLHYPAFFFRSSRRSAAASVRPAPQVGEHNSIIRKSISANSVSPGRSWPSWRKAVWSERMQVEQAKQALAGLKVLDFTWLLAGPVTTRYLADHGAQVVKVESPLRPDELRAMQPFKEGRAGANRSVMFAMYNTNKVGVTLDLNNDGGRSIARRLAAWADVVIQGFRPGVSKRLGLDYGSLKKVNRGLIMVSVSMQGQSGPYARQPLLGIQFQGGVGLTDLIGWPDREPAGIPSPYPDFIFPPFIISSIAAALHYRRVTGHGQHIDISQLETSLYMVLPELLDYTANGRVQTRCGNRSTRAAPHGVYCCRGDERWCAIAITSDEEWSRFCSILGNPPWAARPEFQTLVGRLSSSDELDRLVERWTQTRTAEEVMVTLQAAGVAAGVVQNGQDLLERDPQLQHRGHFRKIKHPEIVEYVDQAPPFKMSKTPAKVERSAPCLGEHNAYACTTLLGMTDEEFAELVAAGAFG